MIDGVKIVLGGREFIVPPLNLKSIRRLAPKFGCLDGLGGVPTDEQLEAVAMIVHAAVSRNHPDVTQEEIEDLLDLGNLLPTVSAVLEASGLKRAAPGEAEGPEGSTGPTSTGS